MVDLLRFQAFDELLALNKIMHKLSFYIELEFYFVL